MEVEKIDNAEECNAEEKFNQPSTELRSLLAFKNGSGGYSPN